MIANGSKPSLGFLFSARKPFLGFVNSSSDVSVYMWVKREVKSSFRVPCSKTLFRLLRSDADCIITWSCVRLLEVRGYDPIIVHLQAPMEVWLMCLRWSTYVTITLVLDLS